MGERVGSPVPSLLLRVRGGGGGGGGERVEVAGSSSTSTLYGREGRVTSAISTPAG